MRPEGGLGDVDEGLEVLHVLNKDFELVEELEGAVLGERPGPLGNGVWRWRLEGKSKYYINKSSGAAPETRQGISPRTSELQKERRKGGKKE